VDEVLLRAGIFNGVEPTAVAALTEQRQPADFPRGHRVFTEGEPGDRLYIIVSGKIKLGRRTPDGRENLLAVVGPSDMFGELSIFDPGPRAASCGVEQSLDLATGNRPRHHVHDEDWRTSYLDSRFRNSVHDRAYDRHVLRNARRSHRNRHYLGLRTCRRTRR